MLIPTVGVIVFKNNCVLLVRAGKDSGHITGVYGLPAGHIDENESAKQAAVPELKEETGLDATESALQEFSENDFNAVIPRSDGSVKEFSWKVFYCNQFSGELKPSSETEPYWIALDELSRYELLPNTEQAILNCLKAKE